MGTNGIPPNSLILAPNTNYRDWIFHQDSGLVGYVDFVTPGAGFGFTIPTIPQLAPVSLGLVVRAGQRACAQLPK